MAARLAPTRVIAVGIMLYGPMSPESANDTLTKTEAIEKGSIWISSLALAQTLDTVILTLM